MTRLLCHSSSNFALKGTLLVVAVSSIACYMHHRNALSRLVCENANRRHRWPVRSKYPFQVSNQAEALSAATLRPAVSCYFLSYSIWADISCPYRVGSAISPAKIEPGR